MNKVENNLVNLAKKMSGKILSFEIDSSKLLYQIDKNANIIEFNLLNHCSSSIGKCMSKGRKTIVNYKKIRKYFGKKKQDTVLCDYNTIGRYQRRFVADSMYLAKKDIYVLVTKEFLDIVIKRYKRYKVSLDVIECKDGYIIKVEPRENKIHYILDKFYLLIDYLYDVIDVIGDILMN